jgi:RHS repeat-associated protein
MKKYICTVFVLLLFIGLAWGQNIQKKGPVLLPEPPASAFIVGSGQSAKITSSTSIVLGPGVHLQQGSNVLVSIGNSPLIPPAPSNPTADLSRNWVLNKTFDEDGQLIAETKSFFDNEGKMIQNQVKNRTAGHVLASEIIYDAQARPALTTLAAPVNNSEFSFKENFVKSTTGAYNYRNFDLQKTNSPDPLDPATMGTLGWYYSNQNNWDNYVPATAFPYSRGTYFSDGTNAGKTSSGIGEEFRTGAGHEIRSTSFPVVNELNNYSLIRNKFFSSSELGDQGILKSRALQSVTTDENNNRYVQVTDLSGKALMNARANKDGILNIGNNVTIEGVPKEFTFSLNTPRLEAGGIGEGPVTFSIKSKKPVQVYYNGTLFYSGIGNEFNLNTVYLNALFSINSQFPFTVVHNDGCDDCPAKVSESASSSIHYFQLLQPSTVSINGNYELYDMQNETLVSGFSGNGILPDGYYKLRATNGKVTLNYSNRLSDLSYNYYNQLGQLVASIAPEGVKKLIENIDAYQTIDQVPFTSRYSYDLQGRLLTATTTDAGKTEYIYRNDGKMRFSQNAEQRKTGKFTYTNYDKWNRTFEAGEYVSAQISFESAKTNTALLENTEDDGGLIGGTRSSQVKTHYELPDNSHGLTTYVQDEGFLKSNISWTENDQSKTWYNYDEQGRVTWIIRQINGLGNKTINYVYNSAGSISVVDFQKEQAAERFLHYYEYDNDLRLDKVYTSINGQDKLLQAQYYYYLHGPLKRVELAENLQGIDYSYTPQGWLKTINHSDKSKDPGKDGVENSFAEDAFGMTLEYYNGDYSRNSSGIGSIASGNAKVLYNGSVAAQTWYSQKPAAIVAGYGNSVNNPAMFTYQYDDKYQFQNSKYGTPNFSDYTFTENLNANREFNISYDANGNLNQLKRTNSAGVNTADFTYRYQANTNKLASVDNYANYNYDELGQMTGQKRTNGQGYYVDYNMNGKVVAIYADAAKTQLKVSFGYDESGIRIRKTDHQHNISTYYVSDLTGNTLATYDNNGGTLQQGDIPVYAADRIGVYNRRGNSYLYELTDHLGNVRVVLNRNKVNGKADVVSYSDYYPFGSVISLANNDYRYGYQGKYAEADKETGWNNFELRMYDSAIGRWLSVDPKNEFFSPYLAMGNNPVSTVDPDGGSTTDPPEKEYYGGTLREVVIRGEVKRTPMERATWRTENGLNIYYYANGKRDYGVQYAMESYGAYRKMMAAQPDFDGFILNTVLLASGGEIFELPGMLYGIGRFAVRKIITRGIVAEVTVVAGEVGAELAAKKGTTVLGHYPQYVKVAETIGARIFQIPTKIWNKMSSVEQWVANQKFLDRMILRGDNIRLATPLNQVKPGSFFQKELNYLFDKGYKVSSDELWLVK